MSIFINRENDLNNVCDMRDLNFFSQSYLLILHVLSPVVYLHLMIRMGAGSNGRCLSSPSRRRSSSYSHTGSDQSEFFFLRWGYFLSLIACRHQFPVTRRQQQAPISHPKIKGLVFRKVSNTFMFQLHLSFFFMKARHSSDIWTKIIYAMFILTKNWIDNNNT
jgi:hypothetical protein